MYKQSSKKTGGTHYESKETDFVMDYLDTDLGSRQYDFRLTRNGAQQNIVVSHS